VASSNVSRFAIIIAFAGGVGLIGAIAAYRASGSGVAPPPAAIRPAVVRSAPLDQRTYAITESFHGLIQANVRVDLAFRIPGRVSQIGATKDLGLKENDHVQSGQTLALLEPERYKAEVDKANAAMEEAKAATDSAQALIDDAKARAEDAKREFDRVTKLRAATAANDRDVERAETALKIAKAQLDGAQAKMAAASAGYEAGRTAWTTANLDLQEATLKAPMPALVAAIRMEVGETVNANVPILTLVDLSKVKLAIGVVEKKLPLLRKGQRVKVEIAALAAHATMSKDGAPVSQVREGTITIVPPAADEATGLFNVEIELANDDGKLRPGMVGKAIVAVTEKKAIAIPAEAVTRNGEHCTAYFVAQGFTSGMSLGNLGDASLKIETTIARKVSFKPMAIDKDFYLVTDMPDGLSDLIVEGQTRLSDGEPVNVIGRNVQAEAQPQQ